MGMGTAGGCKGEKWVGMGGNGDLGVRESGVKMGIAWGWGCDRDEGGDGWWGYG